MKPDGCHEGGGFPGQRIAVVVNKAKSDSRSTWRVLFSASAPQALVSRLRLRLKIWKGRMTGGCNLCAVWLWPEEAETRIQPYNSRSRLLYAARRTRATVEKKEARRGRT